MPPADFQRGAFSPTADCLFGKAAKHACAVRATGQCRTDPINREILQVRGAQREDRLDEELNELFGKSSLGIQLLGQL
jgi:hypothetical protein